MTHLMNSLAWCWVQVFLVAAVASALSLLALRRSPMAGATIAWSGVIAALVLTVLAIVPLPKLEGPRALSELVSRWHDSQTTISQAQRQSQACHGEADEPGFRATLDASLLPNLFTALRNSESVVVRHYSTARFALVVFAMGLTVGLLRILGGLLSISALRRRSTLVVDPDVTDLLAKLTPCLSLRHLPQIRETSDLASAAALGWWQPAVLLPAGWRAWSPAELKAVLAHELAHLARYDAPWRSVAALLVALHWGQPLVHWLRRQLLLAQELAADELAAAAMGSQREYLQALAKLALRQDSRPAAIPPAAPLPVFSGFLLRRIAMLRAKDGSLQRKWRLFTQGSALALVVAATLFAFAIRGLAEPSAAESDGSLRVANAKGAKPAAPTVPTNQAAEAAPFQRAPIDISKLAFGKQGGFLVRLGEIFQQPRFAEAAREQEEFLFNYWKTTFPGAEAPPCSLKDIEYIAGDFMLSAKYVAPPKDEKNPHPHQVMFGSQCAYIRWRKPVDEIFAWLKRTPGAEAKQHGDISYVALPLAIMGPALSCFCRIDDHTLLWAGGEGVMGKRLDQLAVANEPPAWHSAWKEVEGGLLTAVAAEAEYKGPPETVTESEQLTRLFFDKTLLKALGADWQPQAGGNTTFKLQLRFENEADARAIESEIRHALALIIEDARADANKAKDESEKSFAAAKIAMFERPRVETRQTASGWQIDIHLQGPLNLESNL